MTASDEADPKIKDRERASDRPTVSLCQRRLGFLEPQSVSPDANDQIGRNGGADTGTRGEFGDNLLAG